ncbi:uncharacterized protein LOC108104361 [Drosophila eugracilis]|uniref:uncharacterized protein LOC108104361 n=1 Tax=Drosophila eugracilis TaxID=29029 RepID=UPI0007E74B8D|nr:uncharacterized protein LOC108104361 [Drosophila eugracilis]
MEVLPEKRLIIIQDQDLHNKVEGPDLQNQRLPTKVQDLKYLIDVQEEKLSHIQLPIKIQDHQILHKLQNRNNHEDHDQEKIPHEIPVVEKRLFIDIKYQKHLTEVQEQKEISIEVNSIKDENHTINQKHDYKICKVENQPSPVNLKVTSQPIIHRPGRLIPPMPSEETMRHSIADNLMEILVNMTIPQYRQKCFELLQVGDALQARNRILNILKGIDENRRTHR